jgi:hypothetical protein
MSDHTFDPREHIRGIHQILISDKKRIGFLFGAGSSFATGVPTVKVPTVAELTNLIVHEVKENASEFETALQEIRDEIGAPSFDIETLLSTIEAKRAVIGNGTLNGLNLESLSRLATLVKGAVVQAVSVHGTITTDERKALAHSKFASWVEKARRRHPAEIFTTNYDYLFEMALEGLGIPYFDGFSGGYEPFFCPEAVEDIEAYSHLVKLWKMHGSLGWTFREHDKAVIRQQNAPAESILIYPSHLKYNTAKKQPYVGLIDRLCTFLQQDDAVLFTCGYAFGDSHINERIATSLRRGANSHVIALYYDEVTAADNSPSFILTNAQNKARTMATHETAGKMSVYGLRHAVIGGKFGEWKLRDEPKKDETLQIGQYFDEDAAAPGGASGKGDEDWRGSGRFLLPDFRKLAEFLNDLTPHDPHLINGQ